MNRIQFMNIQIDNVNLSEAVDEINNFIIDNKHTFVVTPNVDHIVKLQENRQFLNAYNAAGLVLVDGTPIMLVAKWLRTPLKEKITGPLLTEKTLKMAAEKQYSVFFLGAGPGVAEKAAKKMLGKYPGFKYAGAYSPIYGFEKDTNEKNKIIGIINKSKAQIVISGMGSPKTEIFLHEIHQSIDANVSLSVGAAIDFMAGTVKRCPKWINKIGMEWFYRFVKEPKRMWKRYFVDDMAFLALALNEKKNRKRKK